MKAIVFALLLVLATYPLYGQTTFYSGDFDPNNPNANGLANENDAIVGGDPYGAAIYQNFVADVPWTVFNLFTNNLSQITPASGYWELRSGVSEGNGGTLIASGSGAMTHILTGRSGFGFDEYQDMVSGLNVSLPAGTYWFAVVPVCTTCDARSFTSNTFGLGQVGTDIPDLQFFNSSFFGANFTNANNEGVFQAFSAGVNGTGVPEPSSLVLVGTGLMGAAVAVRRRFS